MRSSRIKHTNTGALNQGKPYALALLLGLFAVILSACNTSETPTPPATPSFNISLPQDTLTATHGVGGNFPMVVTINRTNFSDDVTLSLEGAGASASFNPSTTNGTSSTMTVMVASSAAVGDYPLSVKATSGSTTKTASFVLKVAAPPVVTVAGKVVDILLNPVANVPVKIGNASTTTNANGEFSISNVSTPYTAIIIDSGSSSGVIYQGLTRTDPTLQFLNFVGSPKTANLAGNLSGGATFPNPAGHVALVTYSAESMVPTRENLASGSGPAYGAMGVTWSGAASLNGKIHALQWQTNASGLPTDYTGYGSKPLSISDGGSYMSPQGDVTLSAGVAEASLTGSISIPSGTSLVAKLLYADFGSNATHALLQDTTPATSFSYTTPNLSGVTMSASSVACGSGGCGLFNNISFAYKTGLAPNAASVSLENPAIPSLSLPVNGATNVTLTTPFSYAASSGSVHFVQFNIGGQQYIVVSSGSETTIPDLSSVGLPLPAATAGTWQVIDIAPFATVDAATSPSGFLKDFYISLIGLFSGYGPENTGSFAISKVGTFTTAP
jgi:hypothetical protein